jgi:hypothetical protein
MEFLSRYRGPDFCEHCGEEIKWVRLISGMWAPVQVSPVLYLPGAGSAKLIDARRDGVILRGCLIYKGGKGMDTSKLRVGYEHHMYRCGERGAWTGRGKPRSR